MAFRPLGSASLGLAPLEADGKQGACLWAGRGFFVGEGGGMPSAVAEPLPQLAVPLAAAPGATCSVRTPCCAGVGDGLDSSHFGSAGSAANYALSSAFGVPVDAADVPVAAATPLLQRPHAHLHPSVAAAQQPCAASAPRMLYNRLIRYIYLKINNKSSQHH